MNFLRGNQQQKEPFKFNLQLDGNYYPATRKFGIIGVPKLSTTQNGKTDYYTVSLNAKNTGFDSASVTPGTDTSNSNGVVVDTPPTSSVIPDTASAGVNPGTDSNPNDVSAGVTPGTDTSNTSGVVVGTPPPSSDRIQGNSVDVTKSINNLHFPGNLAKKIRNSPKSDDSDQIQGGKSRRQKTNKRKTNKRKMYKRKTNKRKH